MPRFAAVWGLGCDLIHYFRKIPKSPCCSPNPALLHPIQNSHWTFLSVLTPKYPKNPCEESDPNPDLPHKSWELQELRGLLSTTDSSRFALRERFETPLFSFFSWKKKKNRRPPHGLRVLRTGCVLAESRTPQWELGLQESTHTCWEQPCLAEGCMRIRVFLRMTYRVTNSPNCMSGLKTG